ncbi:hypothetical protein IMZ31_23930 (plasmid) [Pontibacillus sp. ALD_SL1]|uniref:hypothetical protein n=1 Tax=Pontibacillus sp. ALD_SL1 TaxID=2777185 RepID=UPI001A962EC8|nr:hypothetical protein [Pontibacillus sp. ALD_SL1]QST02503.1 hypothetical protein IMZ31_23930 [Pontibacillus sp. ALD_SL1]
MNKTETIRAIEELLPLLERKEELWNIRFEATRSPKLPMSPSDHLMDRYANQYGLTPQVEKDNPWPSDPKIMNEWLVYLISAVPTASILMFLTRDWYADTYSGTPALKWPLLLFFSWISVVFPMLKKKYMDAPKKEEYSQKYSKVAKEREKQMKRMVREHYEERVKRIEEEAKRKEEKIIRDTQAEFDEYERRIEATPMAEVSRDMSYLGYMLDHLKSGRADTYKEAAQLAWSDKVQEAREYEHQREMEEMEESIRDMKREHEDSLSSMEHDMRKRDSDNFWKEKRYNEEIQDQRKEIDDLKNLERERNRPKSSIF